MPLAPPPGATPIAQTPAAPLAPPAGAVALAPPVGAIPVSDPNATPFDHHGLAALWRQAGGDPKAADMMGHIAMEESSGDPKAHNEYTDNKGKVWHVAGPWQISDIHGPGNYYDPLTNAKKAVELYNARRSKGGTGFEDWEDSRNKGAGGGWGKYYVQYVAKTTPAHVVPTPGAGVNKAVNTDERKGNYNIAEAFAGHQELPFMAFNAWVMDGFKMNGDHMNDMMDLWKPTQVGGKGSPGAASALYGANAPKVLDAYEKSGNPALVEYAKMLKANSWLAGAATFTEEFFNPMSWIEGGAFGKGLGVAMKGARMIPKVDEIVTNMQHIFSQYKDIVGAHGTDVRNRLAAVGQQMSAGEKHGHDAMMNVFGGLTDAEATEVIRRQQGLAPNTALNVKGRGEIIDKAAAAKQQYTRELTAAKLATGVLTPKQIHGVKGSAPTTITHGDKSWEFDFDPGTYHGLRNQYSHPNAKYNDLMEDLEILPRGAGNNGGPTGRKTYDNIDEAMADHESGAVLNTDHPTAFRNFMTTGNKRVAFEKGMRMIAESHPEALRVPLNPEENKALVSSGKYMDLSDTKYSGLNLRNNRGSSFMLQAVASPSMWKFLTNENSMSKILGRSMAERGYGEAQWAESLNHAWRSTIVANPAYHPFWNVATNASAAAGHFGPQAMGDTILNYTRALLGTAATVSSALEHIPTIGRVFNPVTKAADFAREGTEHIFLKNAQVYQDAVHEALDAGKSAWEARGLGRQAAADQAMHYGANAEFGAPRTALGNQRTPGRVFARKNDGTFNKLEPRERIDQMLTKMDQWNQEGTFGARGEQAFATTLFHQLYSETNKRALFYKDPYGASWAVREALGNYKNLDPANEMSKYAIFIPWLVSNVGFWSKALVKNPGFINAPTQASRTQRENSDDPTAYNAAHPRLGISTYEPDAQGEKHRDIPLPLKDAERFAQAAYDMLNGHFTEGGQGIVNEFASRAKPLIGAGLDTVSTLADEKANPPGTFVGHNVMFDKNDPQHATQQWMTSVALNSAPLPFPFVSRNIAQNLIQQKVDTPSMTNYIEEALGMGYISEREADSFKRAQGKPDLFLQRRITIHTRVMNSSNPMDDQTSKDYLNKTQDAYKKMKEGIKAEIERKKKAKGVLTPPTGAIPIPSGAVAIPQ